VALEAQRQYKIRHSLQTKIMRNTVQKASAMRCSHPTHLMQSSKDLGPILRGGADVDSMVSLDPAVAAVNDAIKLEGVNFAPIAQRYSFVSPVQEKPKTDSSMVNL
jgi:hypothetical protein